MRKKGIFAFDIDGTLTDDLQSIHPRVVNALRDLVENGWHVALMTGRIYSFADQGILPSLDFPYFLGVQNGADILEMPAKRSIHRCYISSELLGQLDEAYADIEGDYIIYSGVDRGDFCFYRPERFSQEMLDYLKVLEKLGAEPWQPSTFQFPLGEKFPLIKCFGQEKSMRALYEKLQQNPEVEVSFLPDPVDRSLHLILITNPEAHKGCAIQKLKEVTGAPIVIAAGDQGNDRKMLQRADISIAVETAPLDMVEQADIIAKPPSEFGIIAAIEEALRRADH